MLYTAGLLEVVVLPAWDCQGPSCLGYCVILLRERVRLVSGDIAETCMERNCHPVFLGVVLRSVEPASYLASDLGSRPGSGSRSR